MTLQSVAQTTGISTGLLSQGKYPGSIDAVVLRHLKTPSEIEGILHLREEIDLSALSAIDSDFFELEKKKDTVGFVFGFELDGEIIGTIRIVPMGHDLTLTETLLCQVESSAPAPIRGDWEVGRLVLAPEFRSDVDALRRCLFLALEYACIHARVRHLYASCTHVLSRLYRRFAFTAFARNVLLPGTEKNYTLIRGSAQQVSMALSGIPAQ